MATAAYITSDELAQRLGIRRATAARMCLRGDVRPAPMFYGKGWRVRADAEIRDRRGVWARVPEVASHAQA